MAWRMTKPQSMVKGLEYYYIDQDAKTYQEYLSSVEYPNKYKYTLTSPGDKSYYAVWKQQPITVSYFVRKDWSNLLWDIAIFLYYRKYSY